MRLYVVCLLLLYIRLKLQVWLVEDFWGEVTVMVSTKGKHGIYLFTERIYRTRTIMGNKTSTWYTKYSGKS